MIATVIARVSRGVEDDVCLLEDGDASFVGHETEGAADVGALRMGDLVGLVGSTTPRRSLPSTASTSCASASRTCHRTSAHGIFVPKISTVAEAEAALKATRHQPRRPGNAPCR
ncbi:hypothetical protein ACWEQP_24660 [Streptomyces sp. NPDC004044]